MSIGRPVATVDGRSAAEAAVRRVRVDLTVDEAHDAVELLLWPGSSLVAAQPGDAITVGLGTGEGDPEDVLHATVVGVDAVPGGALLTAYAPSRLLSFVHVGRSWRVTTLGQVVRDLLDEGGVDAGDVTATLSLPTLHVDPRHSVWSTLHDLARRTGHQVTSTPDGKVAFGPVPGGSAGGLGGVGGALAGAAAAFGLGGAGGELREGAELLAFRAGARPVRSTLTRVSPAGPAAAFLLEAAPDDGRSVQVIDPALRTREAAEAATSAAVAAAARAGRSALIRVPGRPSLRAGGTVRARGQSYRVLTARHVLDPSRGYVCDLVLEGDA